MSSRVLCAQHKECANVECLRKPTAQELEEFRSVYKLEYPKWQDYHWPKVNNGPVCLNFKRTKNG